MADLNDPNSICKWCGDPVSLNPNGNLSHVFVSDEGNRWWLFNCQHTVKYGTRQAALEDTE